MMDGQGNMVSRIFAKWVSLLNSAGGALIFALIIMINVDVFSRFLFNHPIDGVAELVELSIVAIVFLQLGDAVRSGRLTRSDSLYNQLNEKKPALGRILGIFFELCGIAFFLTIVAGSIPRLVDAWQRNYYAGNQGIFTVPVWPVRLILVVGAITVVFVFVGLLWRHFQGLRNPGGDVK